MIVTNNAQVISDHVDPTTANNHVSLDTRVFTPKGVGGEVAGINQLGVWMPWLALALVLAAGVSVLLLSRRRRS